LFVCSAYKTQTVANDHAVELYLITITRASQKVLTLIYLNNTHTTVLLLFWNLSRLPGCAGTRKAKTTKVKPIWIYWSKR